MAIFTKIAGMLFIGVFSIAEIVTLWYTLPTKFSFSEFTNLNSIMPIIVLIAVFGFLLILGIGGFLSGIFGIFAPVIGLVVVFLEIGTQQNLISTALNDIHTYFSSSFVSTITPFFAFLMIAFGFVLELVGSFVHY